jgi:4-diphosphocytidyl-2-C-methyl-D-erythritol kinase
MIVFPNCKINLGLKIAGKRPDNFHDLETVFYPLPLRDVLEIIPADNFEFSLTGADLPGESGDNLCIKAYQLLKKDFRGLPGIRIYLHKNIPAGAGLGGGSADGAFMLGLLNTCFRLNLSQERLAAYALELGSDCPFFIHNIPCFASGRGEILTPVKIDLSTCSFLLVNPGIHIETGRAFSRLVPSLSLKSIREIIGLPLEKWSIYLKNDFEELVLKEYPALRIIKESLYSSGAVYASMSGSGSCFYGIFRGKELPRIDFAEKFQVIYL